MNDLANKGKRALYSIYKLSTVNYVSITTMLQVFETTIKPILLYGSEIWGHQSKNDNKIERVQTMFGKHILGVHRKSINAAILGELGLRKLKTDMQINALKFYDYLEQNKNDLIKDSLIENRSNNTPWYRNIRTLIDELHFDLNILFNKNPCKDVITYKKLTQKNNRMIKKYCKKPLTRIHDEEWKNKISQMSKMKFYTQFKHRPTVSKYLSLVHSRPHRQALTRLLISAHKLKIETSRYSQNKKLDTNNRICDFCEQSLNLIDDEMHFIFDCTHNQQERTLSFNLMGIYNTTSLHIEEKIEILSNILENDKEENELKHFVKFIYESERKRFESTRK